MSGTTERNHVFNKPSWEHLPEKNNSRQSKCHAFLPSSGISMALLALEEIGFLLIQEWPGWAVTLDWHCHVTLIRATTARSLCALFQLCSLECWDTGGRSPQPEQFSSCWNNWLLHKLVCSAGREAGRRKISSLCITRSRFGGSGKKPSCSHITMLPACHLSKSNYLEMAGEEEKQGYSSAVTQTQPQSLIWYTATQESFFLTCR